MGIIDDNDIVLSGADAQNFIQNSQNPSEEMIARRNRFMNFISENCAIEDSGNCFSVTIPDNLLDALALAGSISYKIEAEYRPTGSRSYGEAASKAFTTQFFSRKIETTMLSGNKSTIKLKDLKPHNSSTNNFWDKDCA